MIELIVKYFHIIGCLTIFGLGILISIISRNLFKKLIGLTVMQIGVFIFFISVNFNKNSLIPILDCDKECINNNFVNPVPQVLILTAIVVGVATLSLGLALICKIQKGYSTVEEDKILKLNYFED